MTLYLPQDCLIALILRGMERIVPKGDTLIREGDEIVMCTRSYQDEMTDSLIQHPLSRDSKWCGRRVCEYPKGDRNLLVMIQRGEERIIPNGNTILQAGDVLVLLKRNQ